jgi:hypothetical protein
MTAIDVETAIADHNLLCSRLAARLAESGQKPIRW